MTQQVPDQQTRLKAFDSLYSLQNKKKFIAEGLQGMGLDLFFKTNDGALQQLKSSGMFNLIQKQSIIDNLIAENRHLLTREQDFKTKFEEVDHRENGSFNNNNTNFLLLFPFIYLFNKKKIKSCKGE